MKKVILEEYQHLEARRRNKNANGSGSGSCLKGGESQPRPNHI
mgnify:FL=1